jgi:DNA-binding transcriptional LysR family regulator
MTAVQLRRLEYFVVMADELHFGRAARRLNIAQPALSQQMQRLESELGVELLKRSPRRIELTTAGELLLEQARALLAHADQVDNVMRAAAAGVAGPLTVGYVRAAGADLLPNILREFYRGRPLVKLTLHALHTFDQIEALDAGRIDIGIVRPRLVPSRFVVTPLRVEPLVAALPSEHPLARARELSLSRLSGEDFVLLARDTGSDFYDMVVSAFNEAGISLKIAQEVADVESQFTFVSAGLSIALVPKSASLVRRPHVTFREVRDLQATIDFALACRREPQGPLAQRFAQLAVAVATGQERLPDSADDAAGK